MHSVKAHHPESETTLVVKPRGLELRTESCDDTLLRSALPVTQPPPSSAEDAKSESETKCSPLPPTEGETTTSSVPGVSNNDEVEEETVATSDETEEVTKLQVQSFVDNFNTSLLEDEAGLVNNMILSKWLIGSVFYCHEDCRLT